MFDEQINELIESGEYSDEYLKKILENVKDLSENKISVHKTRPFYTPQEISRFMLMRGKTKPSMVDESFYTEWLNNHKDECRGFITEKSEELTLKWINVVQELQKAKSRGEDVITDMKLLGWNPSMEFTMNNRQIASDRLESKIYEGINNIIVDGNLVSLSEKTTAKNPLNPLFIVLVEGNTPIFSDLTKVVTHGPFSHAAIGLDAKLEKLYSFNLANGVKSTGGFSIENVKDYPPKGRLGVFCIFVKDEDLKKIQDTINTYMDHIKDTSYSIVNLMALPFNAVIKMDFEMICSQFVDNLLKICQIDITNKESPLVTPNDLYRSVKINKKIYKIYEGVVSKYKPDKIEIKLNKLSQSAQLVKECTSDMIAVEAAEFPVQFSKDGDLLIKKIGRMDYEKEYRDAHRLLQQYHKADNVEGMKYELAALWFINLMLERDIYNNKDGKEKEYQKCRARVLNDFNNYMGIVLQYDKKFNFKEYFESTPFNTAVIKINHSTLKYTIDGIKGLLQIL